MLSTAVAVFYLMKKKEKDRREREEEEEERDVVCLWRVEFIHDLVPLAL